MTVDFARSVKRVIVCASHHSSRPKEVPPWVHGMCGMRRCPPARAASLQCRPPIPSVAQPPLIRLLPPTADGISSTHLPRFLSGHFSEAYVTLCTKDSYVRGALVRSCRPDPPGQPQMPHSLSSRCTWEVIFYGVVCASRRVGITTASHTTPLARHPPLWLARWWHIHSDRLGQRGKSSASPLIPFQRSRGKFAVRKSRFRTISWLARQLLRHRGPRGRRSIVVTWSVSQLLPAARDRGRVPCVG